MFAISKELDPRGCAAGLVCSIVQSPGLTQVQQTNRKQQHQQRQTLHNYS